MYFYASTDQKPPREKKTTKSTVLKQKCPCFKSNKKEIFTRTVLEKTFKYDIGHGQTAIIKKKSVLHFTSILYLKKQSKEKQNLFALLKWLWTLENGNQDDSEYDLG